MKTDVGTCFRYVTPGCAPIEWSGQIDLGFESQAPASKQKTESSATTCFPQLIGRAMVLINLTAEE